MRRAELRPSFVVHHYKGEVTPAASSRAQPLVPFAPAAVHGALDPKTLPPAARRELSARLARSSGVDAHRPGWLQALVAGELDRAKGADARVSAADMQRAVARSRAAAELVPAPQRDLFGFTRLVDAKFDLDARSLEALASAAIGASGDAELLGAIDRGPPDGGIVWRRPRTSIELVASLVRQVALGAGASLHIQIDAPLADWLERTLTARGSSVRRSMGGAGGFGANLASTLPNVVARFSSSGQMPCAVRERFSKRVGSVDQSGAPAPLGAGVAEAPPRINFAAEYKASGAFSLRGQDHLAIDGRERQLRFSASGRVILGTPSADEPGFDLSDTALERVAREHDLAFLVGAHYLTKGSPEECAAKAERLAAQYRLLRRANPGLLVHHQYVVPKLADNEAILMRALRGAVGSFSLNAVELAGLLTRLRADGVTAWQGEAEPARETAESPSFVLDAACALALAQQLQRVHVHGGRGDLVVQRGGGDPERLVLALLRARQLACMKAANDSGEIKEPTDIWPLVPIVDGENLATVQAFADAIEERFGLSAAERDEVAKRWWYRGADGTLYLFAPNRGIHDFTGGTVSLGDTIDVGALVHQLGPSRRGKRLLHPAQNSDI